MKLGGTGRYTHDANDASVQDQGLGIRAECRTTPSWRPLDRSAAIMTVRDDSAVTIGDTDSDATEDVLASAELHALVRRWRQRLVPKRIPGLPADSQRRKTVSQETIAALIGVSAKWYGHLERGELNFNYSDEFLDRCAYALNLSEDERRVLYFLAVGHEPAALDSTATHDVGDAVRRIVETLPWPAWVSDQAWDRIVENSAAHAWFPHMAFEKNIMRWVFYYPQSKLQLVDWYTSWAPSMLAQMRAANAKFQNNARLTQVINETLAVNEFARHLWDTQPMVYVHPDGDRRRLLIPDLPDPIEIEIVAWAPMGHPDLRIVMLIPTNEAIARQLAATA